MRAVVYHGPGHKAWEEVPDPEIIGDGDAIVRVDATTICGTDLHILKGDVPAVRKGRILGHEAVGTIIEVADGGRIANVVLHGAPATLHLEDEWIRDITITTGLVDTSSTPTLMRLVTSGQISAKPFITHHFGLDEWDEAYAVFSRSADTGAQGRPQPPRRRVTKGC